MQEIEDRKRIQQLISRSSSTVPADSGSLKHYSTDALMLKVESLQAQLNEQVRCASAPSGVATVAIGVVEACGGAMQQAQAIGSEQ